MKHIFILALLALSGCASDEVPPGNIASLKNTLSGAGGKAAVMEIQLDDGTRCAVLIGAYQGAIDCDWRVIRVD